MTSIRVLHIDDEADIREVVAIALEFEMEFSVQGCASGEEGIAAAKEHLPDFILLDVMMPGMTGPATLAALREIPQASGIPVMFMTAGVQKRDLAHLKSLGAIGAIPKPFDPLTLAKLIRSHLQIAKLDTLHENFARRLQSDAVTLVEHQQALSRNPASSTLRLSLQSHAHKLAGAAGVFGFQEVSLEASALEQIIGNGDPKCYAPETVSIHLTSLIECIERELTRFSGPPTTSTGECA